MMYSVEHPFRLDQGDVSFEVPASVKEALARALTDNRTHYVQTTGIPPLVALIADKLRRKNRLPIASPDEVMVTSGGIHGLYAVCQAILEPRAEVLLPDPEWPPARGNLLAARAVPVPYRLYESRDWRPDVAEMAALVTPRTRAIYINSPHNPTGGVLPREDLASIAELATARDLWVLSDEAYEDVLYDHHEHVSIGSLPGLHPRVISIYTFSKTYAMTGLRLGYIAVENAAMRDRLRKVLFYTVSNTSSLIQYGGVGALEGSQEIVNEFRAELAARRDVFYRGLCQAAPGVLSGNPPAGAFYAFVHVNPEWCARLPGASNSPSWAMAEFLIRPGRIGCVPGADFGPGGESTPRICFARDRAELSGALESLATILR